MRSVILIGLAALGACNIATSPAAPTNEAAAVNSGAGNDALGGAAEANAAAPAATQWQGAVVLAGDGLTSSGARVAFDIPRAEAERLVGAALGAPKGTGRNEECGQGPVDTTEFEGGMILSFQDGKFVGWDAREGSSFAAANGVRVGMTRQALQALGGATIEESSLGHELTIGGISGLLSGTEPTATITSLWAGSTCIFR